MAVARKRVVVTGLGLVTPLATGVEATWKKLINSESGIRKLEGDEYKLIPSKVGAKVIRGIEKDQFDFKSYNYPGEKNLSNFTLFGIAAATQALRDAGLEGQSEEEKLRTGVCVGSGIGSVEEIAETANLLKVQGLRKVSPFFVPKILINLVSGHISIKYGFRGPNHAVSTACATGAHAIGDAMRFIQYGDADVMVAGGCESSISPLGLSGFCRAKSLSTNFNENPTESSRPFDEKRDGFVMGEGAGVVILEELEHAKSRNAKIYAEIKGYGLTGDGYHYTSPPDDGSGAARAMRRALEVAQVRIEDVDYINCHATGTPQGDLAENRAIKSVFYNNTKVKVSSTKGSIGHLLGAAGSVEAIFTILSLYNKVLPPTLNLTKVSDEKEFSLDYIPLVARDEKNLKVALNNSFGFGGTNCSLCFSSLD